MVPELTTRSPNLASLTEYLYDNAEEVRLQHVWHSDTKRSCFVPHSFSIILEMSMNKTLMDAGGNAEVDEWQRGTCCTCSTL